MFTSVWEELIFYIFILWTVVVYFLVFKPKGLSYAIQYPWVTVSPPIARLAALYRTTFDFMNQSKKNSALSYLVHSKLHLIGIIVFYFLGWETMVMFTILTMMANASALYYLHTLYLLKPR